MPPGTLCRPTSAPVPGPMDSLPARLKSVSPEVIYSDGGFFAANNRSTVALLKDRGS